MKNLHNLILTLILLFSSAVIAQPGSNDPTFNSADKDKGVGSTIYSEHSISAMAEQADGKIIIGGQFNKYDGIDRSGISRANSDGSIDLTFDPGTGIGGDYRNITAIKIQADNRIIIAGRFTTFNGELRNSIVRLEPDGSIDNTFEGIPDIDITVINDFVIQPDGKIIIGGSYEKQSNFSTEYSIRLLRLNTDGSIDPSFIQTYSSSGLAWISSLALLSNGQLIVGGIFTSINDLSTKNIVKLNSDGSTDNSFIPSSLINNAINKISVQADGKLLILQQFLFNNKPLLRLNADGSDDNTFDIGTGLNHSINSLKIQADGKIIIGGYFTSYDGTLINRIARLNDNGSLDATFDPGTGVENIVNAISILASGKILIAGHFNSYNNISRNRIAMLDNTGNLILTAFNYNSPIYYSISESYLQPDGKIIILGGVAKIGRLNEDGTLDLSFDAGSANIDNIYTAAVQHDEKIIIGGQSYGYINDKNIARLNSDGTIDASFATGSGPNNSVHAITVLDNGKILIGGNFTTYNGITRNRIALLNSDGTLDTSFDPGVGPNNSVSEIEIQSTGEIVIGGGFSTYNGISRNRIARLHANGTLDNSFDPGTGANNYITEIAIHTTGEIFIAGDFTSYDGVGRNKVALLNSNGTLNTSFDPGTGANSLVRGLSIQPTGEIIIIGNFTQFNNKTVNRIAKINSNGSLDESYNSGTGANNVIFSILQQIDGKVIIAGAFTSYNNIYRSRIARLIGVESKQANDAGVYSLIDPVDFCPGSNMVKAEIRNNGNNIIDNVEVHWEVNGIFQIPVMYDQPIDVEGGSGSATASIDIGNYNFQHGINYSIKIWTSNPNYISDLTNYNDTFYNVIKARELSVPILGRLICDGGGESVEDVILDAGNVGATYLWSTNETTQTISISQLGIYAVTVTAPDGCVGEATGIIIDMNPSVSLPSDTFVFYGLQNQNECVSITAHASGGNPENWQTGQFGYLFNWYPAGSMVEDYSTSTITVCPTEDTYYTVTVTDQGGGCQVTDSVLVKAYDISCGNNSDKIKVCINGNQTICLTQNAADNVLANNPNAQLGDCEVYFKRNSDINNALVDQNLFPNPTSGSFTIQYNDGVERNYNVRIFDITGRLVHQQEQFTTELNMQVDLNGDAEGTYMVTILDMEEILYRSKVILLNK